MPEENVELVRRTVTAWNNRDLDGLIALADPGIEYVNSRWAVEPGTRYGIDELTAVLRAQWEILLDGRLQIQQIFDLGKEVLALGQISSRMPGSDARIGIRFLGSYVIRDGKLVRYAVFTGDDVGEALEAAGLSE